MIQVEVFWFVMSCSVVEGYQCFSTDLWNIGILP